MAIEETTSVPSEDVPEAFDEVAHRYDLMVALNPGYHRHLRNSARELVADLPRGHTAHVVDLGCGSGASTRALLDEMSRVGVFAAVLGVDASVRMLAQAWTKRWPPGVEFVHGRAEGLSAVCESAGFDEPLDAVFAAYLLRNVDERDRLLSSVYEQLRPGGTLVIHEYSVADRAVSQAVWTAVCRGVVVPLGWLTSRQTRLYHYLWRSVLEMDSVDTVMERMVAAGFEDVRSRTVRGWQRGIIHTFHARRPCS